MQRAYIRHQKLALSIVVSVVPSAPRQNERALDAPVRVRAKLEAAAGQQGLRDRVLRVLDPPRAQVLREHGCRQAVAELVLHPGIARGIEVLFNEGPKQQIAHRVSGDQRGAAPRTADGKLNVGGGVSGVQVLVGERSGFVNRAAGYGNPIKERTGGEVNKLTKQVLVHEHWGDRVAADGKLQAAVERD